MLPLLRAASSRFILTDQNRAKPERGIVLAVGPGLTSRETGRFAPLESKVGEPLGRFRSALLGPVAYPRGNIESMPSCSS